MKQSPNFLKVVKAFFVFASVFIFSGLTAQIDTEHYIPPFFGREDVEDHYILFSTLDPGPVSVTITYGDGTPLPGALAGPHIIDYNNPLTLHLGTGYAAANMIDLSEVNSISNEGLIVTATAPIFCNIRHNNFQQGMSLTSKGTSTAKGTYFRSGHVFNNTEEAHRKSHVISVMATEDNTVINFSDISPNVVFYGNPPTTITLNKGESYVITALTDESGATGNVNDVNGTLITSDKPIVVNSGSWLAGSQGKARDIGMDQLVPIELLGSEYIVVQGQGTANTERVLVVFDCDNTDLYVNGGFYGTFNAGDHVYVERSYYTSQNMHLSANCDFFVYQNICGPRPQNPSLNFIPPLRCAGSQEVVIPDVGLLGDAEISIVARVGSNVFVNGSPIGFSPQAVVGNPNWETYKIPNLTSGDYYISSDDVINVALLNNYSNRGGSGYFSGFTKFRETDRGDTTQFLICELNTSSFIEYSLEGPYYEVSHQFLTPSTSNFTYDGYDGDSVLFTYQRQIGFVGVDSVSLRVCKELDCPGAITDSLCETSVLVFDNVQAVDAGIGGIGTVCNDTTGLYDLTTLLTGAQTGGYWVDLDTTGALFVDQFNPNLVGPGTYDFAYVLPGTSICIDTTIVTVDVLGMDQAQCCAINPNVNITNALCFQESSGVLQIIDLYATQFSIDNGASWQSVNVFDSLMPGNYDIISTFGAQCSDTLSVTINEPPQIAVSANVNDVNCFGESDGSLVVVTATGGTPALVFSMNNSAFTSQTSYNGLSAGTYTLRTRDANNCEDVFIGIVNEPAQLQLSVTSQTDESCTSGNGQIQLGVVGGNPGVLTYEIISPITASNTTGLFTGLSAGTYTLTVLDPKGCTDTLQTTLVDFEPPTLSVGSLSNASCNGSSSGEVNLSITGGVGPYTYRMISPSVVGPQANNIFSGLGAGVYQFEVTDQNSCLDSTVTINITEPTPLTLSTELVGTTCSGTCDGEVRVELTGGTGPFTASIAGVNSAVPFNQFDTLRNICSGTSLNIVISDANNCFIDDYVDIVEPAPLAINSTPSLATDESCYGACDGQIDLSPTGGSGSYETSDDNGVSWSSTLVYSNLCVSNDLYLVRDAAYPYCQTSANILISGPSEIRIVIVDTTESTCGTGNGSVSVEVFGGENAPYDININAAATPSSYTGVPQNSTRLFGLLSAGVYVVEATDQNGCTVNQTVGISDNNLDFSVDAISIDHVDCNGQCDGSAVINASGGVTPYTYALDTNNYQASSSFVNLCASNYMIAVRDNNGCIATDTFNVNEPEPLIVTAFSTTDLTCFEGASGEIEITTTTGGNIGALQYAIDTLPGPAIWQASSTFTGLSAGIHEVIIRDDSMCTYPAYFLINEPNEIILSPTTTSPLCNGDNTGYATIGGSGGTGALQYGLCGGPYIAFDYIASLPAGNHCLEVRDANGCLVDTTVNITEPTALNVISTPTVDLTCYNECSGEIKVNATGGTAPLTFSYNGLNYVVNDSIVDLCAGSYEIVVIDDNSCADTVSNISINQPTALDFTFAIASNTTCENNNGQLDVVPSGATPNYQFILDYGATPSPIVIGTPISNLSPGYHDLRIIDNNGCYKDSTFYMDTDSKPSIDSIRYTRPLCYGNTDATVQVYTSGGIPTKQFEITGVTAYQSDSLFTGLPVGSYKIRIRDNNLCVDSSVIVIEGPGEIEINATISDLLCYGDSSGVIGIQVNGGTPSFEYALNSGAFDAAPTKEVLQAGVYTVNVRDANGCQEDTLVSVNEPAPISFNSVATTPAFCYGNCDGVISIGVSGGTSGSGSYNIQWSNGASATTQIRDLCPGFYSVLVRDDNNCLLDSLNLEVVEPAQAVIDSANVTNVLCKDSCNGQIVFHSATASSIDLNPLTGSGSFLNTNNFNLSGLCAGTYEVTPYDLNFCMGSPTQVYIGSPQQLEAFVTNGIEICSGDSILVYATGSGGTAPYNYVWNNGVTSSSFYTHVIADSTYKVMVTDNNGCTLVDSSVVPITVSPALSHTLTPLSKLICDGDSVQFFVYGQGGVMDYTYQWNIIDPNTGDTIPTGVADTNYNFIDTINTVTQYYVEVMDQCLQTSGSDVIINLDVPPTIVAPQQYGGVACYPSTVTLQNLTVGAGPNSYWVIDGDTVFTTSNTIDYEFTSPGCYDIVLGIESSTLQCPSDTLLDDFLCMEDRPVADFTHTPENPTTANNTVEFINQSIYFNSSVWSIDTKADQYTTDIVTVFDSIDGRVYQVCLEVTNQYYVSGNGCIDTLCKDINVEEVSMVFAPNAFTPDGDGKNDVFIPKFFNINVRNYEFSVWDRWGTQIFITNDPYVGWDGIGYKDGVYVWKVDAEMRNSGEVETFKGHITLLR